MKKILIVFLIFTFVASCKDKSKTNTETPTRGNVSILADDTFFPIIEDHAQVFESQYKNATISVINNPELEIVKKMVDSSSVYKLAVLSRDLTDIEKAFFAGIQITPKIVDIAYDAIALIVNKDADIDNLNLDDFMSILNGEKESEFSLVFDNSASSIVQFMTGLTKNNKLPSEKVYSQNTNEGVIKFIAENKSAIGFIGVNWLVQPPKPLIEYTNKVKVLEIGNNEKGYFKPTQENIATKDYPFVRTLKFIDCQGAAGLGLGFSVFVAGDVGQRIVLKSGLAPIKYPKREISVRDKI